MTPSLIKGTPPLNNRHPPFLLIKRCDPSIEEICNYGDLWCLMLVLRGVQYFQRTHSCWKRIWNQDTFGMPRYSWQVYTCHARRDQRNQQSQAVKWRTRHKARKQTRRRLARCLCLWLVWALLPAKEKKVPENEAVICDFPLEICIKPTPIGWILGG